MVAQAPAAPNGGQSQYPPTTWHNEARQRIITTGSVAWDGGLNQPVSLPLLPTGFLERVYITTRINTIYGTASPTTTDAVAAYAGPVNRLELSTATLGMIFSVSGEMSAIIRVIDANYHFDYTGSFTTPANGYAFTAAPGTTANVLENPFYIPVAIRLDNWPNPVGLYQLAAYLQTVNFRIYWRPINATANVPASGVYVPGTAVLGTTTGTATVHQQYYETFANSNGLPDMRFLHRWREQTFTFAQDQDVEIPIIQENFYARILYWVFNNGVPTYTPVTKLRLEYGGNTDPRVETIDQVLNRMNAYYGNTPLPPGLLAHDFLAESHTDRDLLNSLAVTRPRSYITIAGGTYTNASFVRTAFEEFCPLRPGNP